MPREMRRLAIVVCCCLLSGAHAMVKQPVQPALRNELTQAYSIEFPKSFGAKHTDLPLPGEPLLESGSNSFEATTGLSPSAFAPPTKVRQEYGLKMAPLESGAGFAIGAALTAGGILQDDVQVSQLIASLKGLEAPGLILFLSLILI